MTSRYSNRRIIKNDVEEYENIFEDRGVNYIVQYDTKNLKYPTPGQIKNLTRVQHVWTVGDRYYKLAARF